MNKELIITRDMEIEAKIRARHKWVEDQCREVQWDAELARTNYSDTHQAVSETTLAPVAALAFALTKAVREMPDE